MSDLPCRHGLPVERCGVCEPSCLVWITAGCLAFHARRRCDILLAEHRRAGRYGYGDRAVRQVSMFDAEILQLHACPGCLPITGR